MMEVPLTRLVTGKGTEQLWPVQVLDRTSRIHSSCTVNVQLYDLWHSLMDCKLYNLYNLIYQLLDILRSSKIRTHTQYMCRHNTQRQTHVT